jgi:membrane protein implicated in regulation of membrane protease activity
MEADQMHRRCGIYCGTTTEGAIMEAIPWFWAWIILAAALAIGEMLSLSFFMLPFAVGAAVAAILNALGLDLPWQFVAFIVVSVIALFALRPLARRWTRQGADAKTGVDRLVGMQGKVVEGRSQAGEFRVLVEGDPWNASATDGRTPELGTSVEVLSVNSNSLTVKALSAEIEAGTAVEAQ